MLAPLAFMLIIPCADGSAACAAAAPFSSAATAAPPPASIFAAPAHEAAPADFTADAAPDSPDRSDILPPPQALYETADYADLPYYPDYYDSGQIAHIIWGGPSLLSYAAFELKPATDYALLQE